MRLDIACRKGIRTLRGKEISERRDRPPGALYTALGRLHKGAGGLLSTVSPNKSEENERGNARAEDREDDIPPPQMWRPAQYGTQHGCHDAPLTDPAKMLPKGREGKLSSSASYYLTKGWVGG